MKTIETSLTAGPDKMLHLDVPVDEGNRDYRVVVLLDLVSSRQPAEDAWPEGFFESTAGAWVGEFPEIEEGPFELRESL